MLDVRSKNRHGHSALRSAHSLFFALTILVFHSSFALAQNRVDLDDLNIKGELLNDNRLRLSARDKHQINDRVSYRTNFRKEVTDSLEIPWPEQENATRGPASDAQGGGQ